MNTTNLKRLMMTKQYSQMNSGLFKSKKDTNSSKVVSILTSVVSSSINNDDNEEDQKDQEKMLDGSKLNSMAYTSSKGSKRSVSVDDDSSQLSMFLLE